MVLQRYAQFKLLLSNMQQCINPALDVKAILSYYLKFSETWIYETNKQYNYILYALHTVASYTTRLRGTLYTGCTVQQYSERVIIKKKNQFVTVTPIGSAIRVKTAKWRFRIAAD